MSAQFGSHSPRTYLFLEWLLFRRGSLRGPEGAITTISLPILFPNLTSQWSNPIPTSRIQKTFPCVAGVSKSFREGNETPIPVFDISPPFSVIKPLSQSHKSHLPQDKNRPIPVPCLSGFGTLLVTTWGRSMYITPVLFAFGDGQSLTFFKQWAKLIYSKKLQRARFDHEGPQVHGKGTKSVCVGHTVKDVWGFHKLRKIKAYLSPSLENDVYIRGKLEVSCISKL